MFSSSSALFLPSFSPINHDYTPPFLPSFLLPSDRQRRDLICPLPINSQKAASFSCLISLEKNNLTGIPPCIKKSLCPDKEHAFNDPPSQSHPTPANPRQTAIAICRQRRLGFFFQPLLTPQKRDCLDCAQTFRRFVRESTEQGGDCFL